MVKNSDQQPGIFVLSLDTELAWGNFERVKSRRKRGEMLQTRDALLLGWSGIRENFSPMSVLF